MPSPKIRKRGVAASAILLAAVAQAVLLAETTVDPMRSGPGGEDGIMEEHTGTGAVFTDQTDIFIDDEHPLDLSQLDPLDDDNWHCLRESGSEAQSFLYVAEGGFFFTRCEVQLLNWDGAALCELEYYCCGSWSRIDLDDGFPLGIAEMGNGWHLEQHAFDLDSLYPSLVRFTWTADGDLPVAISSIRLSVANTPSSVPAPQPQWLSWSGLKSLF